MKFAMKACRHCGDSISQISLERHEGMCAMATPERRAMLKNARLAARVRPERILLAHPRDTAPAVAVKRGRPPGRRDSAPRQPRLTLNAETANGNGRRFSITVSVDFENLRKLLIQLGPSLSIDKTEVI